MSGERAAENCPFYPACYVAGDCEYEGWKTGQCGLPNTKPTPTCNAPSQVAQPSGELREKRHALCLLIEDKCPHRDPDTGIAIGTEVEALADAILALAPSAIDRREDHAGDVNDMVERCAGVAGRDILELATELSMPAKSGETPCQWERRVRIAAIRKLALAPEDGGE